MLSVLLLATLAASTPSKPVVAALYFENNTGQPDLDVLQKGLLDMVVTDLVGWDGVTVVDRNRLDEVLHELSLQKSKAFDPATANKVGKLVAAQFLLRGGYELSGRTLRINAQLSKVETGATVAQAHVQGDRDTVFDLEQQLVNQLTANLDAKPQDAIRKRAKVPDYDALLAYSKAIDLSDQGKVEEANQAMSALVSKSPSFLMARERKQQYLDALKAREKLRQDLTTGSVLELGKLADQTLAKAETIAKFDALEDSAQRTHLAMRVIKARFLMRLLKQFVSSRRPHTRVMLKGKEPEAIKVLRTWVDNQESLIAEAEHYLNQRSKVYSGQRVLPNTRPELDPHVDELMRDAKFGEIHIDAEHELDLAQTILTGRCNDGPEGSFTVAPALGDLDEKLQKATFTRLDQGFAKVAKAADSGNPREKPQLEFKAYRYTELEADALERLDKDEDAIKVDQRFLDAFPTASNAPRLETKIKQMLGVEHEDSHVKRERWAKALQGCDDMDIRIGIDTLYRRVLRLGRAALQAQYDELNKACQPTPKNRAAMAAVARDLAMEAAQQDDCDAVKVWMKQYLEQGGSPHDLEGYQKNYIPWCQLGEITQSVAWFASSLDEHWTLEFNHHLVSILSSDGKVLNLNAGMEGRAESIHFRLEDQGGGHFSCVSAQWSRPGENLKGTCQVTVTKLGSGKGEWDEGTYQASFPVDEPARKSIALSNGKFRVRRE